jgi:hypothetical protein
MKNNKTTDLDDIPSELLKTNVDLTVTLLHPLLQQIWNTETFPQDWNEVILIPLPKKKKKGDLSRCNNWRGINLLCTSSKVFTYIIMKRLECLIEPSLRDQQNGFRPRRSCTNHICTIRKITEPSNSDVAYTWDL